MSRRRRKKSLNANFKDYKKSDSSKSQVKKFIQKRIIICVLRVLFFFGWNWSQVANLGASLAIPLGASGCLRQDVEMVEMPKRAFPAKPGMPLFGALHQKTEAFQNFAAPRCVKHEDFPEDFRFGIFLGFRFRRLKQGPGGLPFFWGALVGLLGGKKEEYVFF